MSSRSVGSPQLDLFQYLDNPSTSAKPNYPSESVEKVIAYFKDHSIKDVLKQFVEYIYIDGLASDKNGRLLDSIREYNLQQIADGKPCDRALEITIARLFTHRLMLRNSGYQNYYPRDSWASLLDVAAPLTERVKDGYTKASILVWLKKTQPELRASLVSRVLQLLEENNKQSIVGIMSCIYKIPDTEWTSLHQYASDLMLLVRDCSLEKYELIEILYTIPIGQRAQLVEHSKPFFNRYTCQATAREIFKLLSKMHEADFLEMQELAKNILKKNITPIDELKICHNLFLFPPGERQIAAELTQKLWAFNPGYGDLFLKTLLQMPSQRRALLVDRTLEILNEWPEGVIPHCYEAFKYLEKVDPDEWEELYELANTFGSNLSECRDVTAFIAAISQVPKEQRAKRVEQVQQIKALGYQGHIPSLFPKVSAISLKDWDEVYRLAEQVRGGNGEVKLEVMLAINDISQKKREKVVDDYNSLPEGSSHAERAPIELNHLANAYSEDCEKRKEIEDFQKEHSEFRNAEISYIMDRIPPSDRSNLMIPLLNLDSTFSGSPLIRPFVIQIILETPEDERLELLAHLTLMFQELDTVNRNYNKMNFLYTLASAPPHQRNAILGRALREVEEDLANPHTALLLHVCFPEQVLAMHDPELLRQIRQIQIAQYSGYWLPRFQFSAPSNKEVWAQCIIKKLNEIVTDIEKLRYFLPYAECLYHALNLPRDHPLFLKICDCFFLLTPEALNNPKHPVTIFKRHHERLKDQSDLMSTYSYDKVGLHMERIRRSNKIRLMKDLPEASLDQLRSFGQRMTNRLRQLGPEDRKKAEDSLNEWELAWANVENESLLVTDPVLQFWLEKSGQPNDLCEEQIYQLRVVAHRILNSSHEVQSNGFSPSEEMFLKCSQQIKNCSAGLQSGVSFAYGLLPDLNEDNDGFDFKQRVRREINAVLQKTMMAIFRENEFLTKASNMNLAQGSHLEIYLKNALFLLIGLDHTLVYDRFTTSFSDELLQKSIQDLADLYFSYFTPQRLIHAVKTELTDRLNNEKSNPFLALKDYFGGTWEQYVIFEPKTNLLELSEEGAKRLLTLEGLL